MKKEIKCDNCNTEMSIEKDFGKKPRGIRGIRYGVKRYHCNVCDTYQTVFASGQREEMFNQFNKLCNLTVNN